MLKAACRQLLHKITNLLNKLQFSVLVDLRLRGSNMYGNRSNQKFNMFKSRPILRYNLELCDVHDVP